ncbi:MAG: threonylcarbamoyl-AMP synthase [Hyphomicrobiaceae bacterium]|nr:MAG: threonylcarbamoyl-AMP synthase [Hyphomicrobiaceae bacterium]
MRSDQRCGLIVAADEKAIARAARLLRDGQLVAFPTETVYGLGADAENGRAVARIFEAKGRPRFNPLILHVASVALAARIGELSPLSRRLAERFWPGPLTLVVPRAPRSAVSDLVTAGLDTIALRVPSHPVAAALLEAFAGPVAAPSANRSGHVSPTRAEHVAADLGGKVAMILDGGPVTIGLESTIVELSGGTPRLLRPGALPRTEIESVLGTRLAAPVSIETDRPVAPGMLESHYAPRAAIRLNQRTARPGEALLAFGAPPAGHQGPIFNLSPEGDLIEAAANLFAALRKLDASGAPVIAVMPIPEEGLGEAINDRLRRAAAPRHPPLAP